MSNGMSNGSAVHFPCAGDVEWQFRKSTDRSQSSEVTIQGACRQSMSSDGAAQSHQGAPRELPRSFWIAEMKFGMAQKSSPDALKCSTAVRRRMWSYVSSITCCTELSAKRERCFPHAHTTMIRKLGQDNSPSQPSTSRAIRFSSSVRRPPNSDTLFRSISIPGPTPPTYFQRRA